MAQDDELSFLRALGIADQPAAAAAPAPARPDFLRTINGGEQLPVPPIPPGQEPRATPSPEDERWANAPWSEVAASGVWNLPSSAANVASGLYQAVRHPLDTAGAIGQVGTGLYSKAKGALGFEQSPEQKARDESVVNAIGQEYGNRYGSWGGFKKALATDPFSVGMDVSLPLTAGAGALPAGVGRAATIAARAIDPVQGAMWAAGRGANLGINTLRTVEAAQSGVPRNLLETATKAGASDNPVLRDAFLRFHKGEGDITELSQAARAALEEVRDNASQRYLAEMGDIRQSQQRLPFTLMDQAVADARQHTQFAGIRSPVNFGPANNTLDRAEALINLYRNTPAAQTMEGFDKLKRALWDLGEQSGNTESKRAINKLYDAARSTVAQQDPQYARLMEFYQGHLQNVNDLVRGLGLGSKTPMTTTVQRLRTAASKPERQTLLDQLSATRSGQELPYMLAGAATHAPTANTMHNLINAALTYPLYQVHPLAAAAQWLGSSPAIAGRINYGAGAAQRYARAPFRAAAGLVPDAAKDALNMVPDNLGHYGLYYPGTIAEDRQGRASGGAVNDVERLTKRLMSLSEQAKKSTNNDTKPLLALDDNTIAHALKTAEHAI